MTTLLVAEHDNAHLRDATAKALAAATALGGPVHVLVAGLNARPAAEAAAKLDGRWIRIAKDDGAAARFTDIMSIDKAFEGLLQPSGKKLTKVKGRDVAGTPTVGLLDQGDNPGQAATLYIATKGPAYPLLVVPAKSKGKVEFRDWNKPVTVTKPAGRTTDLSSIVKS